MFVTIVFLNTVNVHIAYVVVVNKKKEKKKKAENTKPVEEWIKYFFFFLFVKRKYQFTHVYMCLNLFLKDKIRTMTYRIALPQLFC